MSLTLVAVPIGNAQDLSIRAITTLKEADIIILEEFKESTVWLRAHGISGKTMETLNEHSNKEDLDRLLSLCSEKNVALITDCGTPGFCDPGADLVGLCRQKNIKIKTIPGPSSLMTLLSLSSQRLDEFVFKGFLPAENEARNKEWQLLTNEKRAIVLMDTPYRYQKILEELKKHMPKRRVLITSNVTQESEQILEGLPQDVEKQVRDKKAEFMVLIYPDVTKTTNR